MNYPLRGGQFTHFEGGIRVQTFVLPLGWFSHPKPSSYPGIVSATDWKATVIGAAGLSTKYVPHSQAEKEDSVNLWDSITAVSSVNERKRH
jgi:hypothetical protein